MPSVFYPAILFPPDQMGLIGVVVEGININITSDDTQSALDEASLVLQETIDEFVAKGVPVPPPADPAAINVDNGVLVLLPASTPGRSVRFTGTMDEDLLRRIDAVASNRSGFLASAARAMLAAR